MKVQLTQPMPTHIVELIAIANTQGHGDEYCSGVAWRTAVSEPGFVNLPVLRNSGCGGRY